MTSAEPRLHIPYDHRPVPARAEILVGLIEQRVTQKMMGVQYESRLTAEIGHDDPLRTSQLRWPDEYCCRRARHQEGNMGEPTVRQIVLASRPKRRHRRIRLEEVPMPAMPPAGLPLRVLYLSLDPYMRGRMDDRKSYAKPVGIAEVMSGESVCEVIGSDRPGGSKRRRAAWTQAMH